MILILAFVQSLIQLVWSALAKWIQLSLATKLYVHHVSGCWFPYLLSFSMFGFFFVSTSTSFESYFSQQNLKDLMSLDLKPLPHSPSCPWAGQRFSNTKTLSRFPEFQSWGIFFLCLSSILSGGFFGFFFIKPQIFHWFKHWKFNLVHTHLPVTNSTNHLIKFQSFQR